MSIKLPNSLCKRESAATVKWDKLILAVLILLYIITFSVLSIQRHRAFASNYDLANMSQTVWNTLHGRIFALSGADKTVSRLSIHADFILIFLTPLYLIWEKAKMLLIVQSVFLGLGAIPVFLLSKKILKSSFVSLALSAAYLLNPGLEWTNIYDFHAVALAIPFLLFAFLFAYEGKWKWFTLFATLAILTKEEVSLSLAMLGLIIALVFKKRWVGLSTFAVGITWFLLMVFLVIPQYSATGTHWAFGWYNLSSPSDQNTDGEISLPFLWNRFLLDTTTQDYYFELLKPLAFLPIVGLPWMILALPELAINVLSNHAQMRSIYFHYDSVVIPALIISTIFGLFYLKKIAEALGGLGKYSSQLIGFVAILLLVAALRMNYHYSPLPTTPSCWCIIYQVGDDERNFEKVLQQIPPNASVAASGEVRAHLTQRENSFNLPNATDSAEYIAILDETRIIGDYEPKVFEMALIKNLLSSKSHQLISHLGHFYLFKKI